MSRLKRKKSKGIINESNVKKLRFIRGVCIIAFAVLIGRLSYIQIIHHEFYVNEVMKQRNFSIPVDSGRGLIFDRNFIPLTDRKEVIMAVIFPQQFNSEENNLLFLEEITGIDRAELKSKIAQGKNSLEFPILDEIDWKDRRIVHTKGLFIINKKVRYEENGLLTHTIGYINQVDRKGMTGIERALDGVLMGNPTRNLIATLDGRKRLLPGEGYVVADSKDKKENIRLTIDYHIQKIVEDVLDTKSFNGAVVISNISTGEILALVSRPNFNPNNISLHLHNDGDELYNKALQMPFPPGSIFKLVVAAEALEKGDIKAEDQLFCSGSETIGDKKIKCAAYDRGGHGYINLEDAIAQSCNSYFIQLGKKIGASNIIEMGEQLGLNNIINIGLKEEHKGYLPKGDELAGPAIGNISIGQGEILVTPLQINQMTQIIANRGVKKSLYLIEDIVDDHYNIIEKSKTDQEKRILSIETADTLRKAMENTMIEGTGKSIGELGSMTAGKTGSAESMEDGNPVVHGWFSGYYPANDPQYSITVFIQKGRSGGATAVPVFGEIVSKMLHMGLGK